jgi:hypothetical protein
MARGRTKNACSEELQRFRGPLHRRNGVQHLNRICRKSSGSSCKSIRLAARSADLSGCETVQIFSSWDSCDNTGIREPPNYSAKPTNRFPLTPMLARIWRRGGDSNPRWRFWPPKRFSKPPHSAALPPLRSLLSIAYHEL